MKKARTTIIAIVMITVAPLTAKASADEIPSKKEAPAVIQTINIIKRDFLYSDRTAAIDITDLPFEEEKAIKKILEIIGDLHGKYTEEDFVAFKREDIEATTVMDGGRAIAVIKLKQFSRGSADEFKKILRSKIKNGIDGLVLDLRDNRGGYLDETILMAGQFIGKNKPLASIENNKGERNIIFSSKEKDFELPTAVIVNHQSASAAEMLASALQYNRAATIVGSPTYGKSQIQKKYHILGKTLSLTTERWRKLNAGSIDDVRVIPDVIVTEERKKIQIEAAKKIVLYKINKKAE